MNRSSPTPGICRIDQPSHRTHGFFVRVHHQGKIHSAFFSDPRHGGREQALEAAQTHRDTLAAKLGTPVRMARRQWAEIVRRKGRSGIVGVQRVINRRVKPWRKYWMATWSPEVGVVRRRQFSIRKHGEAQAKELALLARQRGLRSMK